MKDPASWQYFGFTVKYSETCVAGCIDTGGLWGPLPPEFANNHAPKYPWTPSIWLSMYTDMFTMTRYHMLF